MATLRKPHFENFIKGVEIFFFLELDYKEPTQTPWQLA